MSREQTSSELESNGQVFIDLSKIKKYQKDARERLNTTSTKTIYHSNVHKKENDSLSLVHELTDAKNTEEKIKVKV